MSRWLIYDLTLADLLSILTDLRFSLALEYGLRAIYRTEFHDIFALERRDPEYGPLLQKMKVVNSRGDSEMNEDQWHAASEC